MTEYASLEDITAGLKAHQAHLDAHMLVDKWGREVKPGDTIADFRGDLWTLVALTRAPGDGTCTNGKLLAVSRNTGREGERYPSVFALEVVPRG